MKPNFPVILLLAALFFSPFARCASREEPANPEALVTKARSQQVWDEQTPPLHVKAELGIAGSDGSTAQGNYLFDWVSPTQWREEIKFANYQRLRVRDAKGYWQKSTLDFQPMLIYELSGMLHVKDVLRVRSVQTFGKVKRRESDGQSCVAVNWRVADPLYCLETSWVAYPLPFKRVGRSSLSWQTGGKPGTANPGTCLTKSAVSRVILSVFDSSPDTDAWGKPGGQTGRFLLSCP